ncbi:MAG: single-stranded DNA-binding protein [Leadbetterella sp.]
MNSVKLLGNVGADVNTFQFEKGKKVSFSFATTETYTNKENQEVKTTQWHRIIALGKVAENCEKIVSKGKFLNVEGKITYRTYQNSNQQNVTITEIVALSVAEYSKAN